MFVLDHPTSPSWARAWLQELGLWFCSKLEILVRWPAWAWTWTQIWNFGHLTKVFFCCEIPEQTVWSLNSFRSVEDNGIKACDRCFPTLIQKHKTCPVNASAVLYMALFSPFWLQIFGCNIFRTESDQTPLSRTGCQSQSAQSSIWNMLIIGFVHLPYNHSETNDLKDWANSSKAMKAVLVCKQALP